MRWLELVLSLAAAGDFLVSAWSCIQLADYARQAPTPARRVGAGALCLICAALALEALLFIWLAPGPETWTGLAATAVVRAVLLAACGLVFVLLLRSGIHGS